jgi:glycosyltransferase involved in cell wall biosynthesis
LVNPIHKKSDIETWLKLQREGNNLIAVVIHDLLPVQKPELFPQSRLKSFQRYLDFTRNANIIFFVSYKTKDDYLQYLKSNNLKSVNQELCVITPNGLTPESVDQPTFTSSKEIIPNALCVSTFEPRKNHIQLLKACSTLWDQGERFTLTLAGSTGWSNQEIRQMIDRTSNNYPGRLKFLINPSDHELAEVYHRASFCIYPAIDEGFGIPVIESIAFKKKVICNEIPAIEFLDQSDYLLMDGTLESLVSAIKSALIHFPNELVKTQLISSPIGRVIFDKCKDQLLKFNGGI